MQSEQSMDHRLNQALYELAKEQYNAEFKRRSHIHTTSSFVIASFGVICGVLVSYYSDLPLGSTPWHLFLYFLISGIVISGAAILFNAFVVFQPHGYQYMAHAFELHEWWISRSKTSNSTGAEGISRLLHHLVKEFGEKNVQNSQLNDRKSGAMSRMIVRYLIFVSLSAISFVPLYMIRPYTDVKFSLRNEPASQVWNVKQGSGQLWIQNGFRDSSEREEQHMLGEERKSDGGNEEKPAVDPSADQPAIPKGRIVVENERGEEDSSESSED